MKELLARLLLAWLIVACASPAWAAVAWENVTFFQSASAVTSHSFTLHSVAGPNSYVGVCVLTNGAAIDVTDVTISAVSITSKVDLSIGATDEKLELWEKTGVSGTPTVIVTTSATDRSAIHAFSYSGVDQATPSGTAATSTAGNTTSRTATATGVTAGLLQTCLGIVTAAGEATAPTDGSQTERWDHDSVGANGTREAGSSSTCTGSCTLGHSWTSSLVNGLIVLPLNPATARRPIAPIIFE